MKISIEWLRELVDLDMLGVETEQIADALTTVGFAVEGRQDVEGQVVLDLDVPTNRPDCLNHLGVARELAVYFRLPLTEPDCSEPLAEGGVGQQPQAGVEILDPELCPRYCARVVTGVQVAESPEWIQRRLLALGHRPINNVVDITNYVLFELGQPLHAFDHALLEEGRIVVRRCRAGERITTLDDTERQPDDQMLLICDANRPLAVGGVMGGADSEVSATTGTVLLESAYFQPASIRRTSRTMGLRTEASYRFERGADPEMAIRALHRASRLLADICGATVVGTTIDEHPLPREATQLSVRHSRISQVVGATIDPRDVTDILAGLGFNPSPQDDKVLVTVPSFRVDVSIEDDLVEEVARHHGYARIEARYPKPFDTGSYLPSEQHDRFVTSVLEGAGFFEAYTLSFTSPDREEKVMGAGLRLVPVANPLTEEATHLRSSLLAGLLDALRYNLNHGARDVRLFEMGRVFSTQSSKEKFPEEDRLGIVMTGNYYRPFWSQSPDPVRFHHLKAVLSSLGNWVDGQWTLQHAAGRPYLHPGVCASIHLEGESIGWAGQIHPRIQKDFKFPTPVFAAELSLDAYRGRPCRTLQHRAVSRFPAVERDLSFLVDSRTEFGTIKKAVQALNIGELKDQLLIDLYQGPNLPPNKVSLTVRLVFADPTRTLTQDEVNVRTDEVLEALQGELAVEPRS